MNLVKSIAVWMKLYSQQQSFTFVICRTSNTFFNSNTTTFFYHTPNFKQNLTYAPCPTPQNTLKTVSTWGDSPVTGSLLKNHRLLELKETHQRLFVIWSCPSRLCLQRFVFPYLPPGHSPWWQGPPQTQCPWSRRHSLKVAIKINKLTANSQLPLFPNSVESDTRHSPLLSFLLPHLLSLSL